MLRVTSSLLKHYRVHLSVHLAGVAPLASGTDSAEIRDPDSRRPRVAAPHDPHPGAARVRTGPAASYRSGVPRPPSAPKLSTDNFRRDWTHHCGLSRRRR